MAWQSEVRGKPPPAPIYNKAFMDNIDIEQKEEITLVINGTRFKTDRDGLRNLRKQIDVILEGNKTHGIMEDIKKGRDTFPAGSPKWPAHWPDKPHPLLPICYC